MKGVHDVVKNELAGGVMPSKYFGANAAWLRLAVISHNVLTALKRLALPAELVRAAAFSDLQHGGAAGAPCAAADAATGGCHGENCRLAGSLGTSAGT